MKIRELCNKLGYEYDPNHSKRCLDKIKKDYLIEQVGQKNNYNVIILSSYLICQLYFHFLHMKKQFCHR